MKKKLHMITFLLLSLGGLHLGLLGLLQYDVTTLWGGPGDMITRVLYIFIGVSAVCIFACHKKACSTCKGSNNA